MNGQPFHDKAKSTPERLDRGLKSSGGLPPAKLLPARATQAEVEKLMVVSTNITMPIETRILMMRAARILDSTPTMIVNAIMNRPDVDQLLKYIIDEELTLLPLHCPECGSDDTETPKNPVTKCRCFSCQHTFTKPLDYGQRIPFPPAADQPSGTTGASKGVSPVPARGKKSQPQPASTAEATKAEAAASRKWTKRNARASDLYADLKAAKIKELQAEQAKFD